MATLAIAGAAAYSERKFSLKELQQSLLAISIPMVAGGIGISMDYFGFSDYHESNLGLAYGKKLGASIDLGLSFNYSIIHISGYGQTAAIEFGLGAIFHPTQKMQIGLDLYNPVGGQFGKQADEKMAWIYSLAIGYEISSQVYFSLEWIKEENQSIACKLALQYQFAKQFNAGIGMLTSNASPAAWAGWAWEKLSVQIHASYHQQLGFSPGISIGVDFGKSNDD
ncbi:MAG: hypothetical protein ACHQEM_03605 [Chitinophagales bacterium]